MKGSWVYRVCVPTERMGGVEEGVDVGRSCRKFVISL